jgi:prevent-host-death family protein
MKTINVRELQQHVRDCVKASQRDHVVVTRHGIPTALIIGVEGADWETLAMQTNPSFWRMIEKRRSEPTVSLATMRSFVRARKG